MIYRIWELLFIVHKEKIKNGKKLFFYILDISVRNISIIYNSNKESHDSFISNPSLNFRKILLNEMLNKFSSNALKIKENKIRRKQEYIRGNKDSQTSER